MPLLDRSGWTEDGFAEPLDASTGAARVLPLAQVEAALAGVGPGQRLGALVPNTTPVAALTPLLDRLALIVIDFPSMGDGRGFSLARALRQQGYGGTLRAAGPLIPDQFAFALHCGFDEIEIGDGQAGRQPVPQWQEALGAFEESYQAGARPSIFAQRAKR